MGAVSWILTVFGNAHQGSDVLMQCGSVVGLPTPSAIDIEA